MTPAFSSPRQTAAFALLLALLLASPVLVAKTGWLNRRDVYPAMPVKTGPFAWIQQQIYSRTDDVDIAFLGSSHIWYGVDTAYVQKQFNETTGREGQVITLGWCWPGYDAAYAIARDLLQHRHVRMLVIDDEDNPAYDDAPHVESSHWLRMGENSDVMAGLPLPDRFNLYGGMVLGTPRNLLSVLRPNLMETVAESSTGYWNQTFGTQDFSEQRGCLRVRKNSETDPNFAPFAPPLRATPSDTTVYSPQTADSFAFTGPPLRPYHLFFARKLAQLCRENGTRLVILHVPTLKDSALATIPERTPWEKTLGAPVDDIGIPGAKLFDGVSSSDVRRFFFNDTHLNLNGQERFTPLVTPALLKLYASLCHS